MFFPFFILLSYPLNFFIYCGMSRQFRATLCAVFCGAGQPPTTSVSVAAHQPRREMTHYIEMSPAVNNRGGTGVASPAYRNNEAEL